MYNKTVLLFTTSFPFGRQENFLSDELEIGITKANFSIYNRTKELDKLNYNISPEIQLISLTENEIKIKERKKKIKDFYLISSILFLELFKSKKRFFIISNLKRLSYAIYKAIYISDILMDDLCKKNYSSPVFYSYWMNDWALVLAILTKRKKIPHFYMRVHGFDIFDERREGGYMPFRNFIFSKCRTIFSNSLKSQKYLESKNIYPEKIKCSYIGVKDYFKISPINKEKELVFVSCSRVVPLKRAHLIVEILKEINIPVKWIHVGDGPDLVKLKEVSKLLPNNIKFDFKGYITNSNLMELYSTTPIDLFLHVSETEGLGVAHLEALSFGIPVFTTNVGGAEEFINEFNGEVFDVDFDPKHVANRIMNFSLSKRDEGLANKIKNDWNEKFNSSVLYNNFYKEILND